MLHISVLRAASAAVVGVWQALIAFVSQRATNMHRVLQQDYSHASVEVETIQINFFNFYFI